MHETTLEWTGCGIGVIFTAVQTQEIFQIISLVLTCLATFTTLAFTLYKWYKDAIKDGKIDQEEIEKGIDIVKDGVEELSDNIDKGDKK